MKREPFSIGESRAGEVLGDGVCSLGPKGRSRKRQLSFENCVRSRGGGESIRAGGESGERAPGGDERIPAGGGVGGG